jgi:hypothetical protein
MDHRPCDWPEKRRHLDADLKSKRKQHATHIRPNSQQAVSDRTEGTSAREPGAVSRGSVLSTRARGSVDSQIPLRDYFLWVGGALLLLLFAADCLLPARPQSKLVESHFTRPPIRITSDLKGPQAVVIETSQPNFLPVLPGKEFAVAPSPPRSSDVDDAVRPPATSLSEQADASDVNPEISPRVHEALAQLVPGASDQAGSRRKQFGLASGSPPSFAQSRSEKRQRFARQRNFDTHQ